MALVALCLQTVPVGHGGGLELALASARGLAAPPPLPRAGAGLCDSLLTVAAAQPRHAALAGR